MDVEFFHFMASIFSLATHTSALSLNTGAHEGHHQDVVAAWAGQASNETDVRPESGRNQDERDELKTPGALWEDGLSTKSVDNFGNTLG